MAGYGNTHGRHRHRASTDPSTEGGAADGSAGQSSADAPQVGPGGPQWTSQGSAFPQPAAAGPASEPWFTQHSDTGPHPYAQPAVPSAPVDLWTPRQRHAESAQPTGPAVATRHRRPD